MNYPQSNKAIKLNMDKSPKVLSPDECFFLRNHEIYLNNNGEKRGTLGKGSPMAANYPACEMDQPGGENYRVGSYNSKLTNELYSWVYNDHGIHYIQRINGDGICEVVYTGCLKLNALPKHSIEQFRAYLKIDKLCANRHGKSLVWVDGTDFDIGMIDVEASIATESFTTPFFELCADRCELIKMCVPDPCGCIAAEFIPLSLEDVAKTNFILDKPLIFSYQHEYYDGRKSIWSDPTKPFYQDSKSCFDTIEGLPRCMKLRIPVGNPLVDKINIAVWKNGGWNKYDTIDKYKKYNSSQQYWYERTLSEEVQSSFSETDCSFDYIFCNDKECIPIAPTDFNRVFNPSPREPQGFFPIGLSNQEDISLAFFNYKQGNCPIDKFEVDKFDVALDCPETSCEAQFTKITTYAFVHNRVHDTNQPIFRLGGVAANDKDDPTDKAYFGGLNQVGAGNMIVGGLELEQGQFFADKTRNFIAYVEGTENWNEFKQFKADPGFVNKEEWGTLAHFADRFENNRWRRAIADGQYFYQKLELKVPKGTRGFLRLTSHQSTNGANLAQDKSTFVIGVFNDITNYRGDLELLPSNTDFSTEEIFFDTCGYDELEIKKAFVVDDNAVDAGFTTAASSYHGYIKDANGRPVEGALIEADVGAGNVTEVPATSVTDHNGFYHFYAYPGTNDSIDIAVKVEQDCSAFSTIKTVSITGQHGTFIRTDIEIEDEDWSDAFLATINAKAEDCDGNPVAGMRVAVSGSRYEITGADGVAEIKVRNYQSRNRTVRVVLLDNGGCLTVDCNNDCNPCMLTASITTPSCYDPAPTQTLAPFVININSSLRNKNGLKAGGRYPVAFVVKGSCGRISAANHIKYIDVPRTQEKGLLNFCSLTYNGNGINLPSWGNCVDILFGENINPFELQWVVDKIERTDDNKIKLTIQSLIDYNKKYFFKTNTVYQWLKGDRIEFIRNGDGQIFNIANFGLLNYLTLSPFHDQQASGDEQAPADFFNQLIISDDGKLDDLEEGAVIELQRPKDCTAEPVYFSRCVSIPLVTNASGNRVLSSDTGAFTVFDTYFVTRKIGVFAIQKFEHKNPSDFWGDAINPLTDAGRPYFANKYENEQRFGRNMTLNSPNEFNRFGDIVKRFDPNTHGDIIAVGIVDNKVGMAISEHDWSPFQVSDELLRTGTDGLVRAAAPDQIISDAEPKLRGAFGCQYNSIGSIFFGDGWATWVDVNRGHYVKCDYNEAVAVDIGKCYRYFRRRCQEIETRNRANADPLNQLRFATGQNAASDVVMLTIKALRDSGINNEAAPFLKQNDTILFDPSSNEFLGFSGYTGEGYGRLDLFDGNGCAFISFLNGLPFIHPIIPERWNEFYGIPCDWYIGLVINNSPEKRKRPLAIEVQSETMFYIKEVRTENPNFISEVPPIRWGRNGDKFTAAFLSNSNSRSGLYGDVKPTGYYFEILMVRDQTDGLKYNTIDNAKRIAYSEIDLVTSKFSVMEQSGLTENV